MENMNSYNEKFEHYIQLRKKNQELQNHIEMLQDEIESDEQQPLIQKEKYLSQQCGSDPLDSVRHEYSKPSRLKSVVALIGSILLVAIAVILIFVGISNSKQANKLMDLKTNPGEGYKQWVETWEDASSFGDLEDTWYLVEEDWKSQGVSVSWSDVIDIKNKFFSSGTVYSDNLLSKLTFEMSSKYSDKAGSCYGWGIGLVIAAAIVYFVLFRNANNIYQAENNAYLKEQEENAKFAKKHDEWIKKVASAKKTYANMQKAHQEEANAIVERNNNRKKKIDSLSKEIESLNRETIEEEIFEILDNANSQVPDNKKYGLDIFSGRLDTYFFTRIYFHLKKNNLVDALTVYYKEFHEQVIMERENERIEEEHRRVEEEERERNRLERQRIQAYEKEQEANRRHQEELAKKEADWAAARIRCGRCNKLEHCFRENKFKNPYCFFFSDK